MADLLDNCRFLAGSMGTADFSDGTADPTFRNLEDAGAEDGKIYPYKAQNATGTEWEIGRGMALNTSGGWILERTSIQDSSNGGSLVNFGTAPTVIITAGKEEFGAETIIKTVADLQADDNEEIGYAASGAKRIVGPGDIIEAQGFRYEVAASDATDEHIETVGGVKLYVLANPDGTVTPVQFGATGGNDTPAILSLWNFFRENPNSTVDLLGSSWRCDQSLVFDVNGSPILKNGILDFTNMDSGEGQDCLAFAGVGLSEATAITSTAQFPGSTLVVADASPFSAGDVIYLASDVQWCDRADEDITNNEFAVIRSISGNSITLSGTIHGRYPPSENARIYKFDAGLRPVVENVGIISAPGADRIGAVFRRCYRPYVRNLRVEDASTSGVWLLDSIFADFDATLVRRASSTGIGNGIVCSGGRWNQLGRVTGEDIRHVVSVGQVSGYLEMDSIAGRIARDVTVGDVIAIGTRDGAIDTHAGAADVKFGNLICDFYEIDTSVFGASINGFNCSVGDVTVKGGFNRAVSFQYRGGGDVGRWNKLSIGTISVDGRLAGDTSYGLVVQCVSEGDKRIDLFHCAGFFGETANGNWVHALSGDINEVVMGPSKWSSTQGHGLYVQSTSERRVYFLKLDQPTIQAPTNNVNYNTVHLDGNPYYTANGNAKAMIRGWINGGQLIGGNFGVRARASDLDMTGTRLVGSTSTPVSASEGSAVRQSAWA